MTLAQKFYLTGGELELKDLTEGRLTVPYEGTVRGYRYCTTRPKTPTQPKSTILSTQPSTHIYDLIITITIDQSMLRYYLILTASPMLTAFSTTYMLYFLTTSLHEKHLELDHVWLARLVSEWLLIFSSRKLPKITPWGVYSLHGATVATLDTSGCQ